MKATGILNIHTLKQLYRIMIATNTIGAINRIFAGGEVIEWKKSFHC